MSDRGSSSWALDSSSSMSLAKSPGCEACGAEVFADYRHFCLRSGLRLPLTPSSPSPKPAAEMVINKKPASKVIKKPKTKTAKKRAR